MRIFYAMVVTLCASDLVSAAPPNDVIRSGTPITLGQYCTAVKGSMQGCNSLVEILKENAGKLVCSLLRETRRGEVPKLGAFGQSDKRLSLV